jgi:hypothetical protein
MMRSIKLDKFAKPFAPFPTLPIPIPAPLLMPQPFADQPQPERFPVYFNALSFMQLLRR